MARLDEDDNEVGYGKPPKKTRFKKGQSGNPKGRPKGAKGVRASLHREMEMKISVREGNRVVVMSKAEAAAKRLSERALNGDMTALKMLLAFDLASSTNAPVENIATIDETPVSPVDLDILAHFFANRAPNGATPGNERGGHDDADA